MRVVRINTGVFEALAETCRSVPSAGIEIVTERSYPAKCGPGERTHCVPDVGVVSDVLDVALKINLGSPIDAAVAPSERSVPSDAFVCSYLVLPGAKFDVANRFTNKPVMKEGLQGPGGPTADWKRAVGIAQVRRASEARGLPVIVKPAFSAATMNSFIIRSKSVPAAFQVQFRHCSRITVC